MSIDSDLDRVRLLIGDTDVTDALLSDDEIGAFIAQRTVVTSGGTSVNRIAAAADAAGAIAARFSRQFDFSEDGQSFSLAQKAAAYRETEMYLRRRQGGRSVPLNVGGTT